MSPHATERATQFKELLDKAQQPGTNVSLFPGMWDNFITQRDKLKTEEVHVAQKTVSGVRAMDSITRSEMDAKIAAAEARFDARIARIESSVNHIQSSTKGIKTTLITTAFAAVIAIIIGVYSANASLVGGAISAFESGQGASKAQFAIQKQIEEGDKKIDKRLKDLDEKIDRIKTK